VLAKLAAPGMCNPADDTACVDGPPTQDAIDHDARSAAQRNHDALNAALRGLLASGKLGQHNGLPASIIVTTTLAELEAAAGRALTGGGSILPMSDVIRLARHARHYLAIFDKGKTLALYHTKRLASPAQRIVLYAKECPGDALPLNWSFKIATVNNCAFQEKRSNDTLGQDGRRRAAARHQRCVAPGRFRHVVHSPGLVAQG
jgi:hypothetical protein